MAGSYCGCARWLSGVWSEIITKAYFVRGLMNQRHENEFAHNRRILDSAAEVWGRMGRAGKLRVGRRAAMMIRRTGIGFGKRVLEIGCGTGELTERLAATEAEIVATDLDENFLQLARSRVNFPNVKFRAAAGETLEDFSDGTFDVVCGLSILHHLDIDAALKNIHRVLKPGGAAVFSEPNMLNPQIALQKNIPWLKKLAGDSPDETAFFRRPLARKLASSGFSKVQIFPFDFLHPAIPDFASTFFDGLGRGLEKVPGVREIAGSLFIFAIK